MLMEAQAVIAQKMDLERILEEIERVKEGYKNLQEFVQGIGHAIVTGKQIGRAHV